MTGSQHRGRDLLGVTGRLGHAREQVLEDVGGEAGLLPELDDARDVLAGLIADLDEVVGEVDLDVEREDPRRYPEDGSQGAGPDEPQTEWWTASQGVAHDGGRLVHAGHGRP